MWLYVPPEYLSARGQARLTSGFNWLYPDIKLSVMLSGKFTQQAHSWRGWRTRPFLERLSGMTLPRSEADHGVRAWISSMAATHASRSVLPVSASARRTRATSGPPSPVWLARPGPDYASLRTSPDIYDLDLSRSRMTFEQWVIALRRACSARKKSAHHSVESGYSSWQTPSVADTAGGHLTRSGKRSGELLLKGQARTWQSPLAGGPKSSDMKRSGELQLKGQVKARATPRAHDWKDGGMTMANTPVNGYLSRQALMPPWSGATISEKTQDLNPAFVEALQGFPIGLTDCGSAVTGLSRWSQLMRSELSRLTYAEHSTAEAGR